MNQAPSVGRGGKKLPRRVYKSSHPEISNHEVRRIAVAATCDPRTVLVYLWGLSQPPITRERIALALRQCGYERLVGTREARASVSATLTRR
jgi:hypothetical protein